jgi:hypothetical protein
MKHHLIFLFSLIMLIGFGCKKEKKTSEGELKTVDYSENYKYFPIEVGREWTYNVKIIDKVSGTENEFIQIGKYNKDSVRTDYFRDSKLFSYTYWSNSNNKLGCCGDMILIDYNQLNCNEDSVLIYTNENLNIKIHQYCKLVFKDDISEYNEVKCVKTIQINELNGGGILKIVQYFGHNVGLIFREETRFDHLGDIERETTWKLKSHNF